MKRWPGIRHLRWLYHARQLQKWHDLWVPWYALHLAESDLAYLDAIWEGKA